MILFLTSNLGASQKGADGVRRVCALDNTNGFVDVLQKHTCGGKNFVFVASDPQTHAGTDSYAKLTFDSFNMSGFNFENLVVLDGRNQARAEEIVAAADIVLLAGGNTLVQNKFFKEMNLGALLKKYKPITIGQSAGSLNMAKTVYCSPEEPDELDQPRYFSGLGLTDVNIEPHFENSPHFDGWSVLRDVLIVDSKTRPFYAIVDGAFVYDDGERQIVYGEAYYFAGGEYAQISKLGQSKVLSQDKQK